MSDNRFEDLLRELAPQVLGALVRRYGQFDICADAVQEALLAAAEQWPREGVPQRPRGWLTTVATRALVDRGRSDRARRREVTAALDPSSQLALTLRAVGGLTTAGTAAALLAPEATVAQRISRAKGRIRDAREHFALPSPDEFPGRLGVVLHVLYFMFSEGYTSASGPQLHRPDLTDARREARTDVDGSLVPLAEQRRERWNREAIAEGQALLTRALGAGPIGPYQAGP